MKYRIYTDGACSGNPGPGGFAYVVVTEHDKVLIKSGGFSENTTNNAMELKAILKALQFILLSAGDFGTYAKTNVKGAEVTIVSDSAYCINALQQGWPYSWKTNDWKTKKGEQVKNKELWQKLLDVLKDARCTIQYEKIKGHAGDKYNELADELAKKCVKMSLERLSAKE